MSKVGEDLVEAMQELVADLRGEGPPLVTHVRFVAVGEDGEGYGLSGKGRSADRTAQRRRR